MPAVTRNLSVEQGVTWTAAWSVLLDGEDLDDADGWSARAQVRAKKTSDEVLHEFTCSVVGSVVALSVLPDESSAWTWRRGVYDVEIFDTAVPPKVVRLVQGAIAVNAEVTRDSE